VVALDQLWPIPHDSLTIPLLLQLLLLLPPLLLLLPPRWGRRGKREVCPIHGEAPLQCGIVAVPRASINSLLMWICDDDQIEMW